MKKMKDDIYIITGTDIYRKNKSITYGFMFESGIDFNLIRDYDKWGLIEPSIDGFWFITNGNGDGMSCSGGFRLIYDKENFNNTVYLMKESLFYDFIESFGKDINYHVFHSKKILHQN